MANIPSGYSQDANEGPQLKAFTAKSLIFGLLSGCIIAGFTYFNDNILQQTMLVGNHFPVGAYILFFFLTFAWNGIFLKFYSKLAFNHKELAVALCMSLVVCWVPSSGLFRYFLHQIILPKYYYAGNTWWQQLEVMKYLPGKIFPLDGILDEKVYMGFVQGLSKNNEFIPFSEIPFEAWITPMCYWGPMLLLFAAAIISLSLIVHRQWAEHEQLSYPIATVASSLIKSKDGKAYSEIFKNRLFWWGVIPVFLIHMFNYLNAWFPESLPQIPLKWDLGNGFLELFPTLKNSGTFNVQAGSLSFMIVGLTYFISSEIGLSVGLSNILLAVIGAQFYQITAEPLTFQTVALIRSGAYMAMFLIIVYTGRSYYFPVFMKSLGLGRPLEREKEAVWAARIFMVSFIGFVYVLSIMGLDWFIALIYAFFVFLLFLVFSRIICETGIPFLQSFWEPAAVMTKLFGPVAIGAGPIVFVYYLGTILLADPRECLMPYVATSFKVADNEKVNKLRLMSILFFAISAGLVVAFVATMWCIYSFGSLSFDGFAASSVPNGCFNTVAGELSFLSTTGQLEASNSVHGVGKIIEVSTTGKAPKFILAGFIAVLLMTLMRFRFSKWPLHPVIFLIWGVYASYCVWPSFLIGWAIKDLVVRFGGGKAYQTLKPIFIGLIMGELLSAGVTVIVALAYYLSTGIVPVLYRILPG